MKTATASKPAETIATVRRATAGPVFAPADRSILIVKAGTLFQIAGVDHLFDVDTPVLLPPLQAGADYCIALIDNVLQGELANGADLDGVLGGFHYAPGGNAAARQGGDDLPAINPFSCWDIGWRPVCPDPRGMTCVDGRFWVDIYLLGAAPFTNGTSRFGVTIADENDPPEQSAGGEPYDELDHPTSVKVFAAFGKELLSPEEFFAAAFGVTEGTSVGRDPKTTGLDAPRTSKWGVMQATGNMSTWGNDGDPDGPRLACRFGGDWDDDGFAGSRCAGVGLWPGGSNEWIGSRGRSDHLALDA